MKPFKSRLFNKNIKPNDSDYWIFLYAEILHRLKELFEIQCPCKKCYMEKHDLECHLSEIENKGKIDKLLRPEEPGTVGYCGRSENGLPPAA